MNPRFAARSVALGSLRACRCAAHQRYARTLRALRVPRPGTRATQPAPLSAPAARLLLLRLRRRALGWASRGAWGRRAPGCSSAAGGGAADVGRATAAGEGRGTGEGQRRRTPSPPLLRILHLSHTASCGPPQPLPSLPPPTPGVQQAAQRGRNGGGAAARGPGGVRLRRARGLRRAAARARGGGGSGGCAEGQRSVRLPPRVRLLSQGAQQAS